MKGFDILKALSGADEGDIADCAEFLSSPAESARPLRRISRTLLIAAVIGALLAVSVSAAGISYYLKRQQELNDYYMAEENELENYMEYSQTPESGLEIISCLADGDFYRVHAAVSPISPEEAMGFFRFNFEENDESSPEGLMHIEVRADNELSITVHPCTNDIEYSPGELGEPVKDIHGRVIRNEDGSPYRLPTAEARINRYYERDYDPESRTLMLELFIESSPLQASEPAVLRAALCSAEYTDSGESFKSEELRELGRAYFTPPEYKPLMLYFPEPIVLTNEEGDVELIYEGFEISNSSLYILMRSPGAEYVFLYEPEMSDEEKKAQSDYRNRWTDFRWEIDTNIELSFSDGQRIRLNGTEASRYAEGVVRGICLIPQPSINLNELESILIAGQSLKVSDCLPERP